jgi:hypothetical protein
MLTFYFTLQNSNELIHKSIFATSLNTATNRCIILDQNNNGLIHETCRQPINYPHHVMCQYTECSTINGDTCRFPFRYKGRMYDTCITVDNKGSNPGDPWCSSLTDQLKNHISGNEASCASNCARISDCPVGFIKMRPESTCYQVNIF